MSEFWGDLGKALHRAADTVTTEVSVTAQEQRVKDAYEAIGRLYCQAVSEGKEPTGEAFDQQVRQVNLLREKIRRIRQNQKV